jgi:hypothetical protein
MSVNTSVANYNGRQPNNTAYIKNFISGTPANYWQTATYTPNSGPKAGQTIGVITTTSLKYDNLLIPGDLFVNGQIYNPSDIFLKDNIKLIDNEKVNKIMNLKPSEFVLKRDPLKNVHYGFIAQEFENEFPELVSIKPDKEYANLKAINYLEIIPLLVNKIQLMQKEIDSLNERLNEINVK